MVSLKCRNGAALGKRAADPKTSNKAAQLKLRSGGIRAQRRHFLLGHYAPRRKPWQYWVSAEGGEITTNCSLAYVTRCRAFVTRCRAFAHAWER